MARSRCPVEYILGERHETLVCRLERTPSDLMDLRARSAFIDTSSHVIDLRVRFCKADLDSTLSTPTPCQ